MSYDIKGLSSVKAQRLLVKHGPNTIPEAKPPSRLKLAVRQLKSPLVYVLLTAAAVTLIIGEYTDTLIILMAVFINTVLGYVQERRASQALEALKKMIAQQNEVIRDGKRVIINASEIVPGDICIINQGDKIPADGKLVTATRLFINEAALTGESLPAGKEKSEKVSMGTIVVSGNGVFVVEKTGSHTSFGRIAQDVQTPDELTPLGEKLKQLSKQLSVIVLTLVSIVFVIGILTNKTPIEIFTTSVALAVSAIPEGLLVALTVVLAIGMKRILERKGLVRNLVSAETLGSVTVICADKTGTITRGEMVVSEVIGDMKTIARQLVLANDLDDPMLIAAYEWAKEKLRNTHIETSNVRHDSIPFTSEERFFASLNSNDEENIIYINGAPDFLLDWSVLSTKEKKVIKKLIDRFTRDGKRVIGLAQKKAAKSKKQISPFDVKSDLTWNGLIVFSDPPRENVGEILKKTKLAGIETLIITGDYPHTALAVMKQVGLDIDEKEIMLGDQLKKISDKELAEKLKLHDIKIFARTTPDQKYKIVSALKSNGEIVAMMGDGVNDAPALKLADIGIVVGNATDVAKESSDLVLVDSDFATILSAIEEGRGIFDNIRKIIAYLLSGSFSEIVAVTGGLILGALFMPGLPISLLAAQILWINLISDGLPHLALTVDPKAKDLLLRRPQNPKESLVSNYMKIQIFIVSTVGGLIALGLFVNYYMSTGDTTLAQSIAFATLGMNSLFYIFSIRTLDKPCWRSNIFENKWLNIAVVAGIVLQVLPFMFPFTQEILDIKPLDAVQWTTVVVASVFMFIIIEATKVIVHFDKPN